MNIHLLCKRYYTNKDLITDRFGRLYHLPIQLARQGANVTVDAIDYRNRSAASVAALDTTFHSTPAVLTKLPRLLFDLYNNARAAKPDMLIASGDSHIGYVGLQIAKRLGIPFVFDVYDYYPAFPTNRLPGMKAMFRTAVKSARLVLSASEPLQQILSAALNKNTVLIENGVDRTLFEPGDRNQARQKLNLQKQIPLVGYFGSITPTRGPLLIEACKIIREASPSLRLVLAGRVTDVAIDAAWIDYLGELPQASVPTLIQACDVVSVPYAGDTFNQMSGACKIAEYLACDKPVVATRVSNHEQIFNAAPASLCAPDPQDMARAIRSQLEHPQVAPFPETMGWESIGRILHQSLTQLAS
ncbi:MAG: hypothetical protein CVV13_13995 [Gammaproteobacteria bacterium HGW-Gammaproteobacteria-3]|jgi:glycosyltransferase involved in cell wall biosynthesis|nr:MAG: hypothetical protein CVV13_13995 [Gammaproteobacteria bacterium HGW-Gammaproteobacteria-3]